MNILYTNFHQGYGGGHTTYIKNLVTHSPFTSYVATPHGSQLYSLLEMQKVKIADIKFPSKFKDIIKIAKSVVKLAKLIDEWQIDLVHTNENADNRIVFIASLVAKKKFKVIFTKHNDKPIKNRFTSRWRFEYFNAAVIYVADSIVSTIGLSPKKITPIIIPNGIDTEKWQQSVLAKHNPIHLISIAGTARCKGIHYLIEALKMLPYEMQNGFKITIVGELPQQDYVSELKLAECYSKINFIGYTSEPKKYLQDADVGFVLSDREETISFACREMMSCGLPVIVSDFGALPSNIDNNINGWITKKSDPQAIATVLQKIVLMSNTELLAFKHAARKKAVHEFDIKMMLDKTYKLYQEVFT
jgi:glycosyltransferase involved in cell wall biosynthesis